MCLLCCSSPERRTRSAAFSPLLAKEVCRELRFDVGAGISDNASDKFDINPSRRPVGTLQIGPPCRQTNKMSVCIQNISLEHGMSLSAYNDSDRVSRSQRKNVRTRNDPRAFFLHHTLQAIDEVEPAECLVRSRGLLSLVGAG